jgi:hypothetical protein
MSSKKPPGPPRPKPTASHCARQRRYLRRMELGLVSVTTDFTPEETGKLGRLNLLRDHQLEDRAAIAEALHALIASIEV